MDTEELNEESYTEGHKMAYRSMLRSCCRELGYDDPEASKAAWIAEKEEIKSTLKNVCIDFGDTDYSDDLHLSDVIEKHLHRHLVSNHNSSTVYNWPPGLKEWLLSRQEDIGQHIEDFGDLSETFAAVIGCDAEDG